MANPKPAEPLPEIPELLAAWKVFHDNLPDGEYKGLGELRLIIGILRRRAEGELGAQPAEGAPCAGCSEGVPVRERFGEVYHIYENESAIGRRCTKTSVTSTDRMDSLSVRELPNVREAAMTASSSAEGTTPDAIFKTVTDHKYIDQDCHEKGCQALVLRAELARLMNQQDRLIQTKLEIKLHGELSEAREQIAQIKADWDEEFKVMEQMLERASKGREKLEAQIAKLEGK